MDCHLTGEKNGRKTRKKLNIVAKNVEDLDKLLKILSSLVLKISSQLINSTKNKKT